MYYINWICDTRSHLRSNNCKGSELQKKIMQTLQRQKPYHFTVVLTTQYKFTSPVKVYIYTAAQRKYRGYSVIEYVQKDDWNRTNIANSYIERSWLYIEHFLFVGSAFTLFAVYSLFACWFQPAQTSQPIVFSSHKKPAPASPNQHQHQPANMPIVIMDFFLCIRQQPTCYYEPNELPATNNHINYPRLI